MDFRFDVKRKYRKPPSRYGRKEYHTNRITTNETAYPEPLTGSRAWQWCMGNMWGDRYRDKHPCGKYQPFSGNQPVGDGHSKGPWPYMAAHTASERIIMGRLVWK